MSSFCRITGSARNLPKPCYFPLLPPISPADAKKLCRITGNVTDAHHYSPIIAFGKVYSFDGIEGCRITKHESFHFFKPIFIKNKDNEKSLDSLTDLMNKIKTTRKSLLDNNKLYVYNIEDQSKSIVLAPEFEEAIRIGDIESLSISKEGQHINLKIKQGRIVKIQLEKVPEKEISAHADSLYYGEGQTKETLEKQQKVLNERNLRKKETMARRRLFEKKELHAEEEERKAIERPKSKKPRVMTNPKRRKEKKEEMEKNLQENTENKAIILPESKADVDEQIWYEQMLADIASAQKVAVNVTTYMTTNFNWEEMSKAESAGIDWSCFPHEDEIKPINIESTEEAIMEVPDAQKLDIAAAVERISPTVEIDKHLLRAISEIKEDNLKTTECASHAFKRLNSEIPTMADINDVIASKDNLKQGFLVEKEKGKAEFVNREQYTPGKDLAISGAMVKIKNVEKFVCGQIIHLADQETFVAGQTVETSRGKRFVPGQTVIGREKQVQFIPGQCLTNEDGQDSFIAGQTFDSKFIPGQMIDRGDNKPVFMSGQTVTTIDGPKFVPGDFNVSEDGTTEFVPGIKLPTVEGDTFVPGQAFQTDTGLNFTPGQIIETEEGPSFVPGKCFKSSDGQKRFVKGDLVKSDDGKMKFEKRPNIPIIKEDLASDDVIIPNEELQLVSISGGGILGFAVNPSNTGNVQPGEKLYGDIIETDTSVLFYLSGKLPSDINSDAKVISGQLEVEDNSQRFIPGKMMKMSIGDKFVPGQMVRTNYGEEFVPGQIVDTIDGPKFVPGQLVNTAEGEKFIPGQVVTEEDGPKFVPGQIIHTKNGATFIPGQVMNTEEGQKFVPGQLVETVDGPMFVPGQVIETSEGPKFVPGTVVETEEGLKYVPTNHGNHAEESEEESEISFQGFDVSPEELQLLSTNIPEITIARSPITKQQSLIDNDTLKKLAVDTMVIHGRTPEPNTEKKKKKRKKGKVVIDAPEDEDEENEIDVVDNGTDKVDIVNHLVRAATSVSTVRKDRELQMVNEILGQGEQSSYLAAMVEAIKFVILNGNNHDKQMFDEFIGEDEQLVADVLSLMGNTENILTNDQATRKMVDALKTVVTTKCDKQISNLILKITEDPENLFTDPHAQVLLTEAVGVVCVTGDVEVASLLEKFISDPSNPNCLKEDKDVLAVLRQLLVLHRIAERNPEILRVLQELQLNPEGVKDRNKIRSLIRKSKTFLTKEKVSDKAFDVRHVTSSKDIPSEVFQQIREDKNEAIKFIEKLPDELFHAILGDQRCGDKFLQSLDSAKTIKSSKELEKFKKGMAIVITKENLQAVIPRHFARSVCYGIMPYILIDEEGYKFFERGLTGRKLAPSRIIENTWYQPSTYHDKAVLLPKRVTTPGMQYQMVFLGGSQHTPALQYTSLVPSSGPTRLSFLEQQRKLSRDSSVSSIRRSTTPSRKYSSSSLHDYYPSPSDVYGRKSSLTSGSYNYTRGISPAEPVLELVDPYAGRMVTSCYVPTTSYRSLDDDVDAAPIARSGTVGKLLDKYSNFSLAKEFGYHNPQGAYTKHIGRGTSSVPEEVDEDEVITDGIAEEDRSYLPSRFLHRTSATPDKILGSKAKSPSLNYTPYQRQFSDIYESDDIETPSSKFSTTSSYKKTPYQNPYSKYLNSDSDDDEKYNFRPKKATSSSEPYSGSAPSYSSRLKEWKNKQNNVSSLKDEEDDEPTPRKFAHNRYETALTGEEDSSLYEPKKTVPYSSSLRKRYGLFSDNNLEDEETEPYQRKLPLRQNYEEQIEEPSYYKKSITDRYSNFKPKVSSIAEAPKNILPDKYKGSKSNTLSLDDKFSKRDSNNYDEIQPRGRKASERQLGHSDDIDEYVTRQPYGQTRPSYESPYSSGGVEWGLLSKRNDPYSSRPSYMDPYPSYGGYSGDIYDRGMMPPSYGPPRRPYGLSGYQGAGQRRYTTSFKDFEDDDDDEEKDSSSNYDPAKEQRSLASKIAKKYAIPSTEDE